MLCATSRNDAAGPRKNAAEPIKKQLALRLRNPLVCAASPEPGSARGGAEDELVAGARRREDRAEPVREVSASTGVSIATADRASAVRLMVPLALTAMPPASGTATRSSPPRGSA